jgi:hypothetical protein
VERWRQWNEPASCNIPAQPVSVVTWEDDAAVQAWKNNDSAEKATLLFGYSPLRPTVQARAVAEPQAELFVGHHWSIVLIDGGHTGIDKLEHRRLFPCTSPLAAYAELGIRDCQHLACPRILFG